MFIEFDFGNFRSFRDMQKFSLEASAIRTNDSGLDEGNVFSADSLRLLRTKAVFGGNASGKSNLAKAIAAFLMMTSRSVVQEELSKDIWENRFQLITEWDDQPIFFQYMFLLEDKIYRYGFQILDGIVSYEWLYFGYKGNEVEYFMRSPDGVKVNENQFSDSDGFRKQALQEDSELFRQDALLLTAGALNGNKLLANLRNEIGRIMAVGGWEDGYAINYAMKSLMHGTDDQKQAIKDLLNTADTGIEDLEIVDLPDHQVDIKLKESLDRHGKTPVGLYSYHTVYDENGLFIKKIAVPFGDWESDGTGKLFGIGALILDALDKGRTIIIDEFDARLHPNLTLKIVKLFNDESTNPNNAQLIFITHDAGLLRRAELRRDQICFVNKDKYGISSLTTLIEYKGVRKDASYEKEYLNGSYSAIPFLDKMDLGLTKKTISDGL